MTLAEPAGRRPRADGERSRRAILDAASRLATVEGLDGLSIGRLAEATGMSKSGLYAHFRSKKQLQLATVAAAAAVFEREVVAPGLAAPTPLARLEALAAAFLSHVERGVFPGGCFFASVSAELDTRPGPVRDLVAEFGRGWNELLARLVADAQAAGELRAEEEPAQVAFELSALLGYGNAEFLLHADRDALERARRGIAARLELSRPRSRPA